MSSELEALAHQAVTSSDFKKFHDAISLQELPKSFGVLNDAELVQAIKTILGDDPTKWVLRQSTWDVNAYNPLAAFSSAETLLHLLWQDLRSRLARKLDAVSRRSTISREGAILCFFGLATFGIVVRFTRSGGAMDLRPLVAKQDPSGVFELTSLLEDASPQLRSEIKRVAFSTDKLVYQRGVLIHVNRQSEWEVFGPTIDTIILAELLADRIETLEPTHKITVLEIGPGSGHLSAVLAKSDRVSELTAVDLNPAATFCTIKNLQINDVILDGKHQAIRVRSEAFSSKQLSPPYDLIVCNPPYIPKAPDPSDHSLSERGRAVTGIELCTDILGQLPSLLSDGGLALVMMSSVSDREVLGCIPQGFEAIIALPGEGRRVPLDVDDVWDSPEWRDQLLREGRIEEDAKHGLWHRLRPVWIKRK
jgi:methylase of polypeptide subunit release factors